MLNSEMAGGEEAGAVRVVDPDTGEVIEGEPKAVIIPAAVNPRAITPTRQNVEMAAQLQAIHELKRMVMINGVHYGPPFPGSDKPTLLKPGAELLLSFFGLHPRYEDIYVERDFGRNGNEPLFYFEKRCRIYINGTDIQVGEGVGQASTWESKYRYRDAQPVCPVCRQPNIRKSRYGGYYCGTKTGGCGTNFDEDDKRITSQPLGKVPNENVFDIINTVAKMAEKRALMQAVLVATGASAFFSQDEQLLEGQYEVLDTPAETSGENASAPQIVDNQPSAGHGAQSKTGAPKQKRAQPIDPNTPWQEHIAGWTGDDWKRYHARREQLGLAIEDVEQALGCAPQAFQGTFGEHKSLIDAAVAEKKAAKKPAKTQDGGKVSMAAERGQFYASRIAARSIIGGHPHVTIWALDERGREDPLPAISRQIEAATLRKWLPETPKTLSADEGGSVIFQHDPDSGVKLLVEWERGKDGSERPVSVRRVAE